MSATFPAAPQKKWSLEHAADLSPLEALAYRSNLLGSNRAIANFGGGNTSAKLREIDHVGREIDVLWVKGSGSDLATIRADGFTGLRLAEILPLVERDAMSDEEMVAYLARCQLTPGMPRASIETLLHAFIPAAHVDHTHPDTIGAIVGAVDGERLAEECFGSEALWIPYIRPGFALSKLVAEAVAERPDARFVLLAKHGLVTWGDTPETSYEATLEAVSRAAAFSRGAAEPHPGRGTGDPRARRGASRRAARCGSAGASRSRLERRAADPPAGHVAGRGRLRLQRRRRGALPDRRRVSRPPGAYEAASTLGRLRRRGRRRRSAARPTRRGRARLPESRAARTSSRTGRPRTDCSIRVRVSFSSRGSGWSRSGGH